MQNNKRLGSIDIFWNCIIKIICFVLNKHNLASTAVVKFIGFLYLMIRNAVELHVYVYKDSSLCFNYPSLH